MMRILLIEILIDALEWLRCRVAAWKGSAYLMRDRLAIKQALRAKP